MLAAEPTPAQENLINDPNNYENWFNSTLTLRYDAQPTPFTAPVSTRQNSGGLPAPITMASLSNCKGAMASEADAEEEASVSGVRQELRTVGDYAQRRGTSVYASQTASGFWVAVGL